MKNEEIPIELLNRYLEDQIFQIKFFNLFFEDSQKRNVKFQITGIKDYISTGDWKPFLQYTLFILPTDPKKDYISSLYAQMFGQDISISTTSDEYRTVIMNANHALSEFLQIFGIQMNVICTRVINKVSPTQLNEGLLMEDKYDVVVRRLVRDVITIFKKHGEGEFGLPEDLYPNEVYYEFPQLLNYLQVFVDMSFDDNVEGYDIEADYFKDEDLIYITIISNPKFGSSYLQDMVGELNEQIRHEIEHIKQYEEGYNFPREPKDPFKYYTQKHELEAQKAGFKRRAKKENLDYEFLVRRWFEENKHKHKLEPAKAELVIQKILRDK